MMQMADQKNKQSIKQRPIDPSTNAEDILGDTSGLYGVTRGSSSTTSAEPDDVSKDSLYFRGGELSEDPNTSQGQDKTQFSDRYYNKQVLKGMSTIRAGRNDAIASGSDGDTEDIDALPKGNPHVDDVIASSLGLAHDEDQILSQDSSYHQPYNQGEQSVSGTTPDVESDDDTLENVHAVGQQLEEDDEHPQELDIARDIDEAEDYHHSH
jgi:hypothetical protein